MTGNTSVYPFVFFFCFVFACNILVFLTSICFRRKLLQHKYLLASIAVVEIELLFYMKAQKAVIGQAPSQKTSQFPAETSVFYEQIALCKLNKGPSVKSIYQLSIVTLLITATRDILDYSP